jgi:predicted enzyme related to lactoylglutathione lyase
MRVSRRARGGNRIRAGCPTVRGCILAATRSTIPSKHFPLNERITVNNNMVGWFEVYVDDMARARAFYERVFETTLTPLGPDGDASKAEPGLEMWAFPMQQEGYGAPGALVRMPGFKAGANSVLVYFICADCAVQARRAADAGGKIFKDKFSIGQYGHIALVNDTEGNMIGLHSMT